MRKAICIIRHIRDGEILHEETIENQINSNSIEFTFNQPITTINKDKLETTIAYYIG